MIILVMNLFKIKHHVGDSLSPSFPLNNTSVEVPQAYVGHKTSTAFTNLENLQRI